MKMISEIMILSVGGDVIAKREYRPDVCADSTQMFYSKMHEETSLVPHFKVDGITFYHIKRQQLHLVATSTYEISPICVIELLGKIYKLLKDFCGTVNEEALHTNMILVYEVLDEILDYGLPQLTSTDKIKPYIQSEPVVVQSTDNLIPGLFGIEHRLAPSDASNKPVIRSKWDQRKNEIFLDVIERMNVLITANGTTSRCEIQGQVTMKSFLMGYPQIKLGLNEDLTVGKTDTEKGYGRMVHLDKLTFHPCVKSDSFEDSKVITIQPPEGEFSLLSYSLHGDLPHGLPFRFYSNLEDKGSTRDIGIGVKLRCEIPSQCSAVNVTVNVPVPASTGSISQRLSGPEQTAVFSPPEKKITWKIKKMSGRSEVSAHFTLIGAKQHNPSCSDLDLGPVALTFEISGHVCSGLQIRFLRVFEREHSYVPVRWIRYITTADSYICKL